MSLRDIIAKLPKDADFAPSSYDRLEVSSEHYKRMQHEHLADSPTLVQEAGYTYGGISVVPNPSVPDGFIAAVSKGKVVGVIDCAKGEATFVRDGTQRGGQQ